VPPDSYVHGANVRDRRVKANGDSIGTFGLSQERALVGKSMVTVGFV